MKIIIVRHEKVDFIWDKKYNSVTYDLACKKYDSSSIVPEKRHFETEDIETIYISELLRTYETACKIFGNKKFIKTSLINEVPLNSFTDTGNMYPLWVWNFMGRLQWLLQNKRQAETRKATILRAKEMIGVIEKNNENCYVITHGFYMRTFIKELKRKGYRIEKNTALSINNLGKITAVKS